MSLPPCHFSAIKVSRAKETSSMRPWHAQGMMCILSKYMIPIAGSVSFCILCYGAPGTSSGQEAQVTTGMIMQAWARYQQSIESAKFTWIERTTVPKGAVKRAGKSPRAKATDTRTFPSEDQTLEVPGTLILDGHRWRYISHSYVADDATGKLVPQACDTVYDSEVARAYMPPATGGPPLGDISRCKRSDYPRLNSARPPFLIFRSLALGIVQPEDCVLASGLGFIGDRPCRILLEGPRSSQWSYWVDPARDYIILRAILSADGKDGWKIDFSYTHDQAHGWVLSGWNSVQLDEEGRLRSAFNATVTHWQINTPLDPTAFVLEFPPGTLVTDSTKPSDLGDHTQYLVLEGGTIRPIHLADRGKSYPELLAGTPLFRSWSVVIACIVCLMCLSILVWRWTRRRAWR
jgi:hypothetical protein